MRWVLVVMMMLLAGCAGDFMGYPENRAKRIEEENPRVDDYLRGIPTMTAVRELSYNDYLHALREDRIYTQQRRGEFIYWATREQLHTPLPPEHAGSPADPYITVTERYRAKLPPGH